MLLSANHRKKGLCDSFFKVSIICYSNIELCDDQYGVEIDSFLPNLHNERWFFLHKLMHHSPLHYMDALAITLKQ